MRAGMKVLVERWRRMVDDAGAATWTDDEAQEILDIHRYDVWRYQLEAVPVPSAGSTVYRTYALDLENLEGTASGTMAWRIYNSGGTAATNYSLDEVRGLVTFTSDQRGTAYYVDARSYDLNAAAADGWRERMATKADHYDFSADNASYKRSQWFAQCSAMADYYDARSRPVTVTMERSDVRG